MISKQRPAIHTAAILRAFQAEARTAATKRQISSMEPIILAAETLFVNLALGQDYSCVSPTAFPCPPIPPPEEYRKLYGYRMVERNGADDVYSKLRTSSPFGKCLFCGTGTAANLDHFLPQSSFAVLSIVVDNLIPCCNDCNHHKSDTYGSFVHPYYDNVQSDVWLHARVEDLHPLTVWFECVPPPHWPPSLQARLQSHFASLHLAELYASQAASELAGCHDQHAGLFQASADDLAAHFSARARSWEHYSLNCWQSALYRCLRDETDIHHQSFA